MSPFHFIRQFSALSRTPPSADPGAARSRQASPRLGIARSPHLHGSRLLELGQLQRLVRRAVGPRHPSTSPGSRSKMASRERCPRTDPGPHPDGCRIRNFGEASSGDAVLGANEDQAVEHHVDDQDKALEFYTEVFGFVKKHDIPVGGIPLDHCRFTYGPAGRQLSLEPNANPIGKTFKRGFSSGIPARRSRSRTSNRSSSVQGARPGVHTRGRPSRTVDDRVCGTRAATLIHSIRGRRMRQGANRPAQ